MVNKTFILSEIISPTKYIIFCFQVSYTSVQRVSAIGIYRNVVKRFRKYRVKMAEKSLIILR